MSDPDQNNDQRKVTDVLLDLESKILNLIKTVTASDMNNKLILNNLNKLNKTLEKFPNGLPLAPAPAVVAPPQFNGPYPSVIADTAPIIPGSRTNSQMQSVEISPTPPVVNRKPAIPKAETPRAEPPVKELRELTERVSKAQSNNTPKIPVGQRITDNRGKDLFMADVLVTNLENGEVVNKSKTNAVGKWQTYLPVGKYSVYISKIIDSVTLNKIESLQEIEVTSQMKSLQLPIAIIKR